MKTNARAWYMAAATVAFAGCSGDPVGESIANQVQALDAGEFVLLNEIELNPPGADTPWQYIELEGTPGASLAGFQVAVLEGAGAASAQMVVDLGTACGGPCAIGSSGILVIKAADVDGGAQGHVPPAGATVVKDAQLNTGALTTGNTAVLLVQGSVAIVEGGAIARGDGGAAILPAGDTLVDGVGWGGAGALVGVAVAQAAGTPDAATRFRNRRDVSAGAWYAGNLAGPASTVAYTAVAAQRSANFPAGGVLTPGAVNLPLEDDAGSDAAAESATPDGGTVESGTSDAVAEAATTDVANETSVPVEAAVDSAVRDASPDAVADVATDRVVIVPIDGAPPVGDAAQDGLVSGDTGPTDDGAVADAIADATGAGGAGGSAGAAGTGGGGTGGGGAAGARLDGGGAAGTGGGAGPDGSDVPAAGDSGGCGCRVPGRSPVGHHGMLALFGLAAWAGARRRRNRRA